jgi:hypothetical protein
MGRDDINWLLMFKCVCEKQLIKVVNGLMLFRAGSSGEMLQMKWGSFGFHKRREVDSIFQAAF